MADENKKDVLEFDETLLQLNSSIITIDRNICDFLNLKTNIITSFNRMNSLHGKLLQIHDLGADDRKKITSAQIRDVENRLNQVKEMFFSQTDK